MSMSSLDNRNFTATNSSMTEGFHTAIFFCNDTSGNLNSSSITFFVNTCVPNLLNTSWSGWSNESCSGTQMNQTRNITQYDNNTCGEIENQTFYEYNLTGPIFQNNTWTDWTNISCLSSDFMNQTRNITQFDVFGCDLNNITFYEYRATESCDFCLLTLAYTAWSDLANITCLGEQMNQSRNRTQYDTNNCYTQTGLASDNFTNITYSNSTLVGPTYLNTTWSDWINFTCSNSQMNQSRNRTQSDIYSCGTNLTIFEYNQLTAPSQSCNVGVGACQRNGTQYKICNGVSGWGDWGNCSVSAGDPTTETCNNIDDDCDGTIDNGLTESQSCNVGVGACQRNGTETKTCSAGSWSDWGNCSVSAGDPTTETCNNIDDDCDNSVDESLTKSADNIFGACSANTQTCSVGIWSNTEGNYVPINEICNNIDDDCDGSIDEDWQNYAERSSYKNSNQKGVCLDSLQQCSSGSWIDWYSSSNIATYQSTESTCDNKDNNCDGSVDEDWQNYAERSSYKNSNQKGVCLDSLQQCSSGSWIDWYSSSNIPFYESPEALNADGKDNNCNGQIDESLNFFPNFIIAADGKAYHIFQFRLGATSCEDMLCSAADYGCYVGAVDVSVYGYGVQTGGWCYKECIGCSQYAGLNIDGAFTLDTGVSVCNGNDKMEAFYVYEPSIGGVFYALKKVGTCLI